VEETALYIGSCRNPKSNESELSATILVTHLAYFLAMKMEAVLRNVSICRMFQKELYNFESVYKYIQRTCAVF
jgi:hypothetical protein